MIMHVILVSNIISTHGRKMYAYKCNTMSCVYKKERLAKEIGLQYLYPKKCYCLMKS